MGISVDYGGPKAMQPILDRLKIQFPVYWGGEAAIEKYGITKIPLLMFVRDGRIVRRLQGIRNKSTLEKEIIEFLGNPLGGDGPAQVEVFRLSVGAPHTGWSASPPVIEISMTGFSARK